MLFVLTPIHIFLVCPKWPDVMFTVYSQSSSYRFATGSYVKFQYSKLNHGNHMNYQVGIFTAPRNGSYEFSFHRERYSGYATIQFERNGEKLLEFRGSAIISPSWLVTLYQGDQVSLVVTEGQIDSHSSAHTIWSGRLVNTYGVAFSSYVDSTDTITSGIINFDETFLNIGNAFNGSVFKAPVSGYYQFSFAVNTKTGAAQVAVMQNGAAILNFYSSETTYSMISPNWIIRLLENDEISLKLISGAVYSNTDTNRFFHGKLVQHDMEGKVMFCAYTDHSESVYGYLHYDYYLVNVGASFNLNTGIFKAPVSGSYELSFSHNSEEEVYIYKNSNTEHYIDQTSYSYGFVGLKWIMDLQQDDEIRIYVPSSAVYTYSGVRIFCGKLIQKCDD